MMRLNALNLLEQKGKSRYWLNKELGMCRQNMNSMLKNETKSIRYEVLETMCRLFECTPNDLLIIDNDHAEN